MLTKDFVKEVEKLGFEVGKSMDAILIFYGIGQVSYALINERFHLGMIDGFCVLPEELKEKLYSLMDEYARTPLDEREEEKKFYLKQNLKHKWLERDAFYYLNLNIDKNIYLIDSYASTDTFKTQFTQAEIEEIKEKFNTSLDDFEQIPVEDKKKEEC